MMSRVSDRGRGHCWEEGQREAWRCLAQRTKLACVCNSGRGRKTLDLPCVAISGAEIQFLSIKKPGGHLP